MLTAEPFKIKKGVSFLSHRYLPWDLASLGKKVNEIIEISYDGEDDLAFLLQKYNTFCTENKVDLSIVRKDFKDRTFRENLNKTGFNLNEVSYEISKNIKGDKDTFIRLNKKGIMVDAKLRNENELYSLSSRIFFHGRYAEDLAIPLSDTQVRSGNWTKDLVSNDKIDSLFIYKKEKLIGFLFYEIFGNRCHLILGGMDTSFSHVAYSFWPHLFSLLQDKNVQCITTLISATNIGIVNLYNYFDFKFKRCLMGYHKHYFY